MFPDIEADVDYRATAIDGGVRSIVHPVNISSASGAILRDFDGGTDYHGMRALMLAMVHRLEAESGWIGYRFPCFVRKVAPVSGVSSLLDYQIALRAQMGRKKDPLTPSIKRRLLTASGSR